MSYTITSRDGSLQSSVETLDELFMIFERANGPIAVKPQRQNGQSSRSTKPKGSGPIAAAQKSAKSKGISADAAGKQAESWKAAHEWMEKNPNSGMGAAAVRSMLAKQRTGK